MAVAASRILQLRVWTELSRTRQTTRPKAECRSCSAQPALARRHRSSPAVPRLPGWTCRRPTLFGQVIPEDSIHFPNFFGTSAASPHMAAVAARIDAAGGRKRERSRRRTSIRIPKTRAIDIVSRQEPIPSEPHHADSQWNGSRPLQRARARQRGSRGPGRGDGAALGPTSTNSKATADSRISASPFRFSKEPKTRGHDLVIRRSTERRPLPAIISRPLAR